MENKTSNDREELRNLIIKHFSEPKFKGLTGNGEVFESKSSVCSDAVALEIKYSNTVEEIHFSGEGCAISLASADSFCQVVLGKTKDEIRLIIDEFQKMLKNEPYNAELLDELVIFKQIYAQRSRIACASLPVIGLELFLKISR